MEESVVEQVDALLRHEEWALVECEKVIVLGFAAYITFTQELNNKYVRENPNHTLVFKYKGHDIAIIAGDINNKTVRIAK
jgi:hypothetical protein